jgi:molybdopterin/thiamine biosynthesis adenylyltransferase
LLVGVGGIGHPCAVALAKSDAVDLVFVDDDRVERSNLHRLFAFDDRHVGLLKAVALADLIEREWGLRRPAVIDDRATPETVRSLIDEASVVVEASDNFATKFLVADACALTRKRSVHGAAVGFTGTVLSVLPGQSGCYRCVFEAPPEGDAVDCATAGVFAPVTALIGAVMAREALALAREASPWTGLSHLDARVAMFRRRSVARRRACPLCCEARVITSIDAGRYHSPQCSQ